MEKFSKKNSRKPKLLGKLRQYCNLSILGYNSGNTLRSNFGSYIYLGKFDLPAIIGLLFKYCNSHDIEFMTIKQGTQYTACYLTRKGERYQKLVFKDCLRFTG